MIVSFFCVESESHIVARYLLFESLYSKKLENPNFNFSKYPLIFKINLGHTLDSEQDLFLIYFINV